MEIKATCTSCGNRKSANAELVGQLISCDLCGAMIRVPRPERRSPFEKPKHADAPPSLIQQLAFIVGLFAGLLTIGRAAVIIFSGAIASGDAGGPDAVYLHGGLLVALAIAYAILGLLYLFAGGYIRAKGAVAAMLVLLTGPAHAIATAASLSLALTMSHHAPVKGSLLKNIAMLEAITLGLLLLFILLSILALLTHPSAAQIRAGRFFTLMALYGTIIFAFFLGVQGFMIMGQNLGWLQIPAALQNNIGLNSALWIAGCTLLWLLGVSAGRSPWFGAIAGLLSAGSLEALFTFRLWQGGPALLARHDVLGYSALGISIFLIVLLACPIALLIKALCERRDAATVLPPEPKPADFVFDM